MPVLLIHGGVARPSYNVPSVLFHLQKIAIEAYSMFDCGKDHVDVVEKAVLLMENDPTFNAGVGSVLNLLGELEMDAAIMDGSTGMAGAVCSASFPKNPIRLARVVMEMTPHVLISGRGADILAEKLGFERHPGPTEEILKRYGEMRSKLLSGDGCDDLLSEVRRVIKHINYFDTVGAVSSCYGKVAAATSTGGIWMKLPGRVGDTPVIGAGTYAWLRGAASGTGLGEAAMVTLAAKSVVDRINNGRSVRSAVIQTLSEIKKHTGKIYGLIAVNSSEEFFAGQTAGRLAWVAVKDGEVFQGISVSRSQCN